MIETLSFIIGCAIGAVGSEQIRRIRERRRRLREQRPRWNTGYRAS